MYQNVMLLFSFMTHHFFYFLNVAQVSLYIQRTLFPVQPQTDTELNQD